MVQRGNHLQLTSIKGCRQWNEEFLKELSEVSNRKVESIKQNVVQLVKRLKLDASEIWHYEPQIVFSREGRRCLGCFLELLVKEMEE